MTAQHASRAARTRWPLRATALVLASLVLVGCGQSGPLMLPGGAQPTEPVPPAARAPTQDEDDDEQEE